MAINIDLFGSRQRAAEDADARALAVSAADRSAARTEQAGAQAAALKPILSQFGGPAAAQIGGLLTSGIGQAEALGGQQLAGLVGQTQGAEFQKASRAPLTQIEEGQLTAQNNQAALANERIQSEIEQRAQRAVEAGRAEELAPLKLEKAQADAALATLNAKMLKDNLPNRLTMPVIDVGSGAVVNRTVDTPSSIPYGNQLTDLQDVFAGARAIQELSELVGKPTGTEVVGVISQRMQSLHSQGVLGFAKRNDMGALQEPDLAIASGVIPNPSAVTENIEAAFRGTLGAVVGLVGGTSVTRAAQLQGFQEQYRVATDDMYTKVVQQLMRNPLMLSDVSDDELSRIPPELADPLMHYLQKLGRDPWKADDKEQDNG